MAGVFAGSALWWLTLVGIVATVRRRAGPAALRRLSWLSAALIAALGVAAVATSLSAAAS